MRKNKKFKKSKGSCKSLDIFKTEDGEFLSETLEVEINRIFAELDDYVEDDEDDYYF